MDGCEVYYYVELVIVSLTSLEFTRTWNPSPLDSEDEGSLEVVGNPRSNYAVLSPVLLVVFVFLIALYGKSLTVNEV